MNDTHGHFVGDQLLTAIANRLELVTRSADTLCRFGGDEFLYLAEGLVSPKEAEVLAERLIRVIAEPYNIAGFLIEQRASIGIVIWDSTCTSFSETIQNVDAALYEAKRNVRGHHVVFTPTMHQNARQPLLAGPRAPAGLQRRRPRDALPTDRRPHDQ